MVSTEARGAARRALASAEFRTVKGFNSQNDREGENADRAYGFHLAAPARERNRQTCGRDNHGQGSAAARGSDLQIQRSRRARGSTRSEQEAGDGAGAVDLIGVVQLAAGVGAEIGEIATGPKAD